MVILKYTKGINSNKFIAYTYNDIIKIRDKNVGKLIKDISNIIASANTENIRGIEVVIDCDALKYKLIKE